MRAISGPDAYENFRRNEASTWGANIERFLSELALVSHKPKFRIEKDDTFFCIGSCFARNIEEYLIYNSRRVLSKRIICPRIEWTGRPNGVVNKFTTASMLNEVEWQITAPNIDENLFEQVPTGWLDRQLSSSHPVPLERAKERRAYFVNDYFARMRQASVFVLTLGLVEAWFDARSGKYLNIAPTMHAVRNDPGRYRVEVTNAQQNLEALEKIRVDILVLSPAAKIIVTVSPVPMNATFSEQDVAVANLRSKSTLRSVAGEFSDRHNNVDYFPTYDMIAMSPRASAYHPDCLHVSDKAVGDMIRLFLKLYTGEDPSNIEFSERHYLDANPDIEAEVRSGRLESGFGHWIEHGRAQGRPLAPVGGGRRI
jgi:hypothetical protein